MAEHRQRCGSRRVWLTGACVSVSVSAIWGIGFLTTSQAVQAQEAAASASGAGTSRVTRVEIERVESPAYDGHAFGHTGPYEAILGRFHGEIDPGDPHNAFIVNLDRAPRNAQGMVEYSADFRILKPIDMTRGNATLFYDVVNRGNQRAFNLHVGLTGPYGSYPTSAADLGDGFLMEQAYTIVSSGWQGDLLPGGGRLTAQFPVATRPDGSPIRRWITTELIFSRPAHSAPVEYRAVADSMPEAKLYRRANAHAELERLPRSSWSFATCDGTGTVENSPQDVCMPAGFSMSHVYTLVYEAQDPIVLGMGFGAIRDFVSFLRHDTTDVNPIVARAGGERSPIRRVIAFGQSQPGRLVRDFVYQGANRDSSGRLVFDGAIAHTGGARRTFTNFEFGMPGRFSRSAEDHYFPDDQFPFTYETLTDPVSGRVDGELARCRVTGTCPRIMQWDSATEGWAGRDSLILTDPLGMTDIPLPENVRVYYFAGTQHQGGDGEDPSPESRGICELPANPNPYRDAQRALLEAMQAWVTDGTLPPDSQHPKLSDGTLVAPSEATHAFPSIPSVDYRPKVNDLFVNDDFALPPRHHPTAEYKVLVGKVDTDGNEIAGVRSTMLQVPLGTYTPWNVRRAGFMKGESCATAGGYIPFAKTKDERGADPRPSLEERYGTHERYVERVRAAAAQLQQSGFLRPQDAERLIHEAEQRNLGLPRTGSQ
jgi:hypothetical protein